MTARVKKYYENRFSLIQKEPNEVSKIAEIFGFIAYAIEDKDLLNYETKHLIERALSLYPGTGFTGWQQDEDGQWIYVYW